MRDESLHFAAYLRPTALVAALPGWSTTLPQQGANRPSGRAAVERTQPPAARAQQETGQNNRDKARRNTSDVDRPSRTREDSHRETAGRATSDTNRGHPDIHRVHFDGPRNSQCGSLDEGFSAKGLPIEPTLHHQGRGRLLDGTTGDEGEAHPAGECGSLPQPRPYGGPPGRNICPHQIPTGSPRIHFLPQRA